MKHLATTLFAVSIFIFTAGGLAAAQPDPITVSVAAAAAPEHFAPHPDTVSCGGIENRAATPGYRTFRCTGSGIATLSIRCYYYNGGPYTNWHTTRSSPVTVTLYCGSARPFLSTSWVTQVPNPFTNHLDHQAIDPIIHHHRPTPDLAPQGATIAADWGAQLVTPAQAAILRPDLFPTPDLASGCYISPSTGHYAKGTCPSRTGSASRGFRVISLIWNRCGSYANYVGTTGVAGSRSSYVPGPGSGDFLPFPWTIVSSAISKTP